MTLKRRCIFILGSMLFSGVIKRLVSFDVSLNPIYLKYVFNEKSLVQASRSRKRDDVGYLQW